MRAPNKRRRLRIVDHNEVLVKLHALAVLLVVHQENVASVLRQVVLAALQRIVKCLGDFEEVVSSGDHIPMRR